jgi:hypothetical protein
MATLDTMATAIERQRKRFAHAVIAMQNADSETARKRHGRRIHNAARGLKEARRCFETFAHIEA